jgi:hypothetical protein
LVPIHLITQCHISEDSHLWEIMSVLLQGLLLKIGTYFNFRNMRTKSVRHGTQAQMNTSLTYVILISSETDGITSVHSAGIP